MNELEELEAKLIQLRDMLTPEQIKEAKLSGKSPIKTSVIIERFNAKGESTGKWTVNK